jgi:hypothetical protein
VRTTCVRYNGILHDFMMLNPLRHTAATTGAIEQAVHVLRKEREPTDRDSPSPPQRPRRERP